MSYRPALPDTVIFSIMMLGLSDEDRIALGDMLLDRLADFPAQDGQRVAQSYAFCLGSCDVCATIAAMPSGSDLVILRAHFDILH